jgi:kinesin family protein 15
MLALFSQKELSRLQGQSGFTSNGSICQSPSAFKWDQAHGQFSPLMFDKGATQVLIYGFVYTVFVC